MDGRGIVAVTGATGRQGGAEVRACDMMDAASLLSALEDAYGVFSVQNPMIDGLGAIAAQRLGGVAHASRQVGVTS